MRGVCGDVEKGEATGFYVTRHSQIPADPQGPKFVRFFDIHCPRKATDLIPESLHTWVSRAIEMDERVQNKVRFSG